MHSPVSAPAAKITIRTPTPSTAALHAISWRDVRTPFLVTWYTVCCYKNESTLWRG